MPLQNARVNFGVIMQAVEDQLVDDGVVDNADQVTWGTPGNIPQFSGSFDILLIARKAQHVPYDGGAGQLMLTRYLDLWLRRQSIADPGGGFKQWIMDTFAKEDEIIDSVGNDNFWPESDLGDFLTVESIKLVGDVPPEHSKNEIAFGDCVCTLEVKYFPDIDPTKGP